MKKAITVLGLGAAAVAISVSNASALEQTVQSAEINLDEQSSATSNKVSEIKEGATVVEVNTQDDLSGFQTEDKLNKTVETNEQADVKVQGQAKEADTNASANEENKVQDAATENVQDTKDVNTNDDNKASLKNNSNANNNVVITTTSKVSNDTIKTAQNTTSTGKIKNTSFLNVRLGSSTSNKIIGQIRGNDAFKILSKSPNGWYKVMLKDGTIGWASGKYINETMANVANESGLSKIGKVNTTTESSGNIVNTSFLNVRQGSSTANKIVGQIRGNEVFKILSKSSNGWYKVMLKDGTTGWASGKYIKVANGKVEDTTNKDNIKKAENTNTSTETSGKIVNTSFLNVRQGSSTSNKIVGQIHRNEVFKILSKSSNGWYKVMLKNGTTGWASGKYINPSKAVENTETKETNNNVKTTINANQGIVKSKAGLNVRSGAGINSSVVSYLPNNEVINILGEENGWYKIKLSNGQIGYVGSTLVKKTDKKVQVEVGNSTQTHADKSTASTGNKIVDYAKSLLGTRYTWGGTTTAGFDCSGFTQYVYKNAAGISIPRVSRAQAGAGKSVKTSDMKAGDLLYFDTMGTGTTSHVGIYMGNGKFIHASGSAARPEYVKISNLTEKWVKLLGARRL